jgi:hypothetical protein
MERKAHREHVLLCATLTEDQENTKLEGQKEHIGSARSHAHLMMLSLERKSMKHKAHRENALPCATLTYKENTKLEGHKERIGSTRSHVHLGIVFLERKAHR